MLNNQNVFTSGQTINLFRRVVHIMAVDLTHHFPALVGNEVSLKPVV